MTALTEPARKEVDALANRFFDAGESQGLDAILELVRIFSQRVGGLHYEVESRDFFPGGFVQRCRIKGKLASGEALAVPLCLIIYVQHGRIARLCKYIDAASIMPLVA